MSDQNPTKVWPNPIKTPLRFTNVGGRMLGIPPALDTPEIQAIILKVNSEMVLTAEEATTLFAFLYEEELFAML